MKQKHQHLRRIREAIVSAPAETSLQQLKARVLAEWPDEDTWLPDLASDLVDELIEEINEHRPVR